MRISFKILSLSCNNWVARSRIGKSSRSYRFCSWAVRVKIFFKLHCHIFGFKNQSILKPLEFVFIYVNVFNHLLSLLRLIKRVQFSVHLLPGRLGKIGCLFYFKTFLPCTFPLHEKIYQENVDFKTLLTNSLVYIDS